jgi:hypothetical protein
MRRNLFYVMFLLVGLLGLGAPDPVRGDTWDMSTSYSDSNNPNGSWSYGWRSNPSIGDDFSLLTYRLVNQDGIFWIRNFGIWAPGITKGPQLYSLNNGQGYPTVRWICPMAGKYNIDAAFKGRESVGVDAQVWIVVEGVSVFSADVRSTITPANYTGMLSLQQGAYVDFVIKSTTNTYFGITGKITSVFEPTCSQAELDAAHQQGYLEGATAMLAACQANPAAYGINVNPGTAVTLTPDLKMHLPNIQYNVPFLGFISLWADLAYDGTKTDGAYFKVTGAGEN